MGVGFCSWGKSDKARRNHLKLHQERFRSDIRKKFFTGMVAQAWHSCQRQWRGPLSLEGFKTHVEVALGNMG